MTYPVTVYRWDDPGAPQITTGFGSTNQMKEILKKCLVTGYGSKLPLGWSVVFEDANGIVFQNNVAGGGSGGMFRMYPVSGNWDTTIQGGGTASAIIVAAKSYSASNSPFLPSQANMLYVPPPSGEAVKPWVIIGTAIGFFIITGYYHASSTSPQYLMRTGFAGYSMSMYVGDIVSEIPNDAYRFICLSANFTDDTGVTSAYGANGGLDNVSNGFGDSIGGVKMYEGDGGTAFARFGWRIPFPNMSFTNFAATGQTDLIIAAPTYLTRNPLVGADNTVTNKLPQIRGKIPGLINTLNGDGGTVTSWPLVRSISSVNHWALRQVSYLSNLWINMVEW